MPHKFKFDHFIDGVKIISAVEGNGPASVNQTFIASQPVRLNESVQLWKFRDLVVVDDYADRLRLTVGGYNYTRVDKDEVTASIHPEQDVEWLCTYRECGNAFTIAPIYDASKGWTVSPDSSTNPVIEIKPIITTKSIPPQFLPTQLWRFREH